MSFNNTSSIFDELTSQDADLIGDVDIGADITGTTQLSLCMRKPTIWVLTRSDTNWAVQSHEIVRG